MAETVKAGHVFVEGRRLWDGAGSVLSERTRLGRDGVVVVLISVDARSGKVLSSPKVMSSGFVELDASIEIMERASEEAWNTLERPEVGQLEWEQMKAAVADAVSRLLYDETRRRPTVLADIVEV